MESETSKVIQLEPRKCPVASFTTKDRKKVHCRHKGITIDEDEKELRCSNCGALVYAFDYVVSLAKKESNLFWELEAMDRQIKELIEQRDQLIKDVSNLRAAKRKLV